MTDRPRRHRRKKAAGGQLIVAGFHRSGTSAVARLLRHAGVHMGDELVGARLSNPFGHYEDTAVVGLHEALLADNGRTWQVDAPFLPAVSALRRSQLEAFVANRQEGHPLWGFKDPRACLFLEVWKALVPGVRVVVVYRHYAAAVASLHRREARLALAGEGPGDLHRRFWQVPGLGLRMWLVHNRALLDFAAAHPADVLAVSFDSLRAGAPLLAMIGDRWGLAVRRVPTFEAVEPGFPLPETEPLRLSCMELVAEAEALLVSLDELSGATGREGAAGG